MTRPAMTSDSSHACSRTGTSCRCSASASGRCPTGRSASNAVRAALEFGYRHIDTAQAYGNEESVGRALRDSVDRARGDLPHDQVLPRPPGSGGRSREEPQAARCRLRRPLHHPLAAGRPTWAWPGMRQPERGNARSIGVSNFSVSELEQVRRGGDLPPVVNQVQFSPFEYRRALLEACERPTSRSRRTARWALVATSPTRRSRDRRAPRAHAGTGAPALVRPARRFRDPQVDSPRAHRGELADLRFHTLRRARWAQLDYSIKRAAPTRHARASGGERRRPAASAGLRASRRHVDRVDAGREDRHDDT